MRKFSGVVSVCLLSLLVGIAQAELKIEHWKAAGGVPVYFVAKKEIPIIDIAVVLSAGSARDGQQWGVAALTAGLLDQGTQSKTADQIAAGFDEIGAIFSADSSRDASVVSLRTLRDDVYLQPALALYREVLSKPRFDEKALQRVKQQTIDSIKLESQDPASVATKTLYQMVYGHQAYAHPVEGTEKSLATLTRQQVQQFYQRFYVNQNAKIILVGDLTTKDAKALADKVAATLPAGQQASPLAPMEQEGCAESKTVAMAVPQSAILMGQLGIDYRDPHYFDLLLANHVLGGAFMTSILMEELRDKQGYTYGVYSGFSRLQARGLFRVLLQTRQEKTRAARDLLVALLKKYWREGPTKQQLREAKLYLLGSFPIKVASNSAILSQLVAIASAGLPVDYLERYRQRVKAVTVTSAKKAFEDAIDLSQWDVVIAGH